MSYAYYNRLLSINLSEGTSKVVSIPEEYFRNNLGGRSLGSRLLVEHKIYEFAPFAEQNMIFMLAGPLSGSNVPGAAKITFFSKSPLTGLYLDSACGGSLAYNIKAAGYDGLIITGKSEKPAYLLITDEKVSIENAEELWGKGTFDSESILRSSYGSHCSVAVIGPAGENLVKFAALQSDFFHQSGRGGIGALFGSKNLKAMVISGEKQVPFYNKQAMFEESFRLMRECREDQKVKFRIRYGTMSTLDMTQKLGCAVVRNFTDAVSDRYDVDMNRDYLRDNYVIRDLACYACPVPCANGMEFKYNDLVYNIGGPEYETMSLIGTNLETSPEGLLYLNWLCDDLGIDTVSAGVTLSCATEAYLTGQLSAKDLGFSLNWGDVDGFAKAFRAIAFRQGIGDLLAEGVKRFAEEMKIDPDIAIHVKGMEIPGYDPRGTTGYALAYAIADRGGCHRRARPVYAEQDDDTFRFSYEGKGKLIKDMEDQRGFLHSLVVCDFIPAVYPLKDKEFAQMLSLATGWEFTREEGLKVGERHINQARIFNKYCGITRKDDKLPGRFFKLPLPRGRAQGQVLDPEKHQQMLSDYYAARGWDEQGIPTKAKLQELGIARGLEKCV